MSREQLTSAIEWFTIEITKTIHDYYNDKISDEEMETALPKIASQMLIRIEKIYGKNQRK